MEPIPKELLVDADHWFMYEAIKQAKKAYDNDEIPIGAVLVLDGQIIARAYNQVELLQDATAHAEILCITSASSVLENWRLKESTLYVTVEPCVMCSGAAIASRVKRVVWGAPEPRTGANGSWIDLFAFDHPIHSLAIQGGVLAPFCEQLMVSFFQKKRKKKKEDKISVDV